MEKTQKTSKIVLTVLIINVMSRALALVANSMITAFYGATAKTSVYTFSITLTNVVTTIIGTMLTTAVIPIYIELRETSNKKRENNFVNNIVSLTILMGAALALIGIITAPFIAGKIKCEDFDFAVYSIRIMMPAVIFISLFFVFSGVLQSRRHFIMPAAVSIPSSFANIIYLLVLSRYFGIKGLVVATLIGFSLQALILVPVMIKTGSKFKISFDYKNEDIIKIFKLSGPVLIGVCAYQVNLLTNNYIAIIYDSEKYVVLNQMQNLGIQIILTIVYAITSVMYPKLSTYAVNKDMQGFKNSLSGIIKVIILLFLPIMVGFILISNRLVDIIYMYGKYTIDDVNLGAQIFSIYALGIIGIGFKEVLDRAFYSFKNTKVSAYNSIIIMIVNITLSFLFVKIWGLNGIALAYSITALLGGNLLIYFMKRKIGSFGFKSILTTLFKSVIACVGMGIVVFLLGQVLGNMFDNSSKIIKLVILLVQVGAGVITYGVCLLILKVNEFKDIVKSIFRK